MALWLFKLGSEITSVGDRAADVPCQAILGLPVWLPGIDAVPAVIRTGSVSAILHA